MKGRKMTYVKAVLIGLDQLGNALSGGNPDCTISGRTGFFQYNARFPMVIYWRINAFIVDLTFYPFDGHGHCRQPYELEKDEEFYATENVVALFLLSTLTLGSCSALLVPFYLVFAIKSLIDLFKKNE